MKPIGINKAYLINEDGTQIVNQRNGNTIKSSIQLIKGKPTGYYYATLCSAIDDEGNFYSITPKRIAVHRLVGFAYLPPAPTPEHVWINHKDGNKANNHYYNLEWTTISENIQHKFDTGLQVMPKGKDHYLYGRKAGKTTRLKMSAAKTGAKHPKFKGYYFVNFKRYESTGEASRATGISPRKIYNRCHSNKFKDEGFYFVPVIKKHENNENSI